MSRVRASDGPGISLFPFLAVLLCTMGALLVLLVIFSRSAAGTRAAAETAALEELAVERESLQWRIDQLRAMRQQVLDDLSQARMGLAGIEDNARELSDELAALERELAALSADSKAGSAALDAERKKLQLALADATAALDEARDAAADRPPAYAIVPYEGGNGTHRRPLYIECSLDGVFLQPENIRLSPSDFEGPPGPGNPLASALRAAREHLAERGRTSAVPEQQPYPLLLVRPSGVMAYYTAREAISSWGSDFGYQLVEEHWQLKFPPPDHQLADVERRAIEEARTRLAWLEQVQASRVSRQSSPKVQYRAAQTRGGVVVDGGPSVLGDQSRWEWKETGGNGQGDGQGQGVFGSPNGSGIAGPSGLGGEGPVASGGRQAAGGGQGPGGDPVLGSGTGTTGAGYGPAGSQGSGDARYGSPSAFAAAASANGNGLAGSGGWPGAASGDGAGTEAGSGVSGSGSGGDGEGTGGNGDSGGANGSAGSAFAADGGAAGDGAGGPASGSAGSAAGSPGAAGGAGMMSMGETGSGGMNVSLQPGGEGGVASLASSRGANWASMATRDRPVPLSRPVQVECDAEELRILDSSRRRVVKRVPLGSRTADSVDTLIYAVREHVETWGIAGDRMYWNPRLVLSATPDGASRREDLEALLAGSGLVTTRRESRAVAENPAAGTATAPSVVR